MSMQPTWEQRAIYAEAEVERLNEQVLALSARWSTAGIQIHDVDALFAVVERLRAELIRRDLWPHYTSTYCMHDLHGNCRLTCKICHKPCLCTCHTDGGTS